MPITYMEPTKVEDLSNNCYIDLTKQPNYEVLKAIAHTVGSAAHMNYVIAQIVAEANQLGFDGQDFVTKINQMFDFIRKEKGIQQQGLDATPPP